MPEEIKLSDSPLPSMKGVPKAPARFAEDKELSSAWRVGYGDAAAEKVAVHRRYEDAERLRAYAFGFASGLHRLFL